MTSTPPAPTAGAPKPAGTGPPTAPKPPRAGLLRDRGVVRRDSVHAQRWSTQGTVKVLAEVDVGDAALVGTTTIGGPLTADTFRSSGPLDVGGAVDVARKLVAHGSLRARTTVHAGDFDLQGVAHLSGALSMEGHLEVNGALIAPSVTAGSLTGEGTLEIPGAVTLRLLDFRFREKGELGSVQAQEVRLTIRGPNPVEMVLGQQLPVTVGRIEAASVELEGVDVRFVRAPSIVLGRHAHVTEYEGRITRRHASARVGPESRSPPPHGLTR